jgi:hypothetical protein
MTTSALSQERKTDPSSVGIRWFKLYEALSEFDSALAYQTKWDGENDKWIVDETATKRTIYSTIAGVTASANEFVPCLFNQRGGFWEVIKPLGRINCFASKGSFSVSSSSLTQQNITSYSETDSANSAHTPNTEFTLGSGILTAVRGGAYTAYLQVQGYMSIRVADWQLLEFWIEKQVGGVGAWEVTSAIWRAHNPANAAGGTSYFCDQGAYPIIAIQPADTLRFATSGQYGTAWSAATVDYMRLQLVRTN